MLESKSGDNSFFSDKLTTLRVERERKGITSSQLARMSWMNAAELSKIERGRLIPYENQAKKIATAIGWDGPIEKLFSPVGGDS